MKHILMLSTGGTIASKQTEHGLAPELSGDDLISLIPELKDLCRITCREILNLDSSNIQPEHWIQIATEILRSIDDFDGIVITHGTDTMAYSASALSFMLQNIQKPVILTGSQLSITEQDTDAKKNILNAFQAAITGLPGIYLVFCGRIILGTHAKKLYTSDFDAFRSINGEDIGRIDEHGSVFLSSYPHTERPFTADIRLNSNICSIKLLPGTDPKLLDAVIDLGYDGIILEAFGCGGIPNQIRSLLPALKKARDHGIIIVIASQCTYDGVNLTVYDVNTKAASLGVISGLTMTFETITAKLMWILAHTTDPIEVEKQMHSNYANEL